LPKNIAFSVTFKEFQEWLIVVDSSVGRVLSFSHEGSWFKSWGGHLFISLLIWDLIDYKLMSINDQWI
jgi:hypothetical protein